MEEVIWVIQSLTFNDIIDILIVALVFYGMSFLFRGTQAITLFRGIFFIVLILIVIAGLFRLQAVSWLLSNGVTVLAIALPVIFQPEIRRALERLGRGNIFVNRHPGQDSRVQIIDEICSAAEKLSERRHGALIVLQRNSGLQEYIRTGVQLNSDVTADLLLTIFWPKTELHDGAVIINEDGKIASAASVLPLTASRNLPNPKMGTRHRAALGISEVGDAVCVVVSEESGKVAITNAGRMIPRLDSERLRMVLNAYYGANQQQSVSWRKRLSEWQQVFSGRLQTWWEQA